MTQSMQIITSILIGIFAGLFVYFISNLVFTPIIFHKPKLRIKHFCYRFKKDDSGKYRFEAHLFNEGVNPIIEYHIYMMNKRIYSGKFIDSHKQDEITFSHTFTTEEVKLLDDPKAKNIATIIYKDGHNNWFYSMCSYFIGIHLKHYDFAKRIHYWDWKNKFNYFARNDN